MSLFTDASGSLDYVGGGGYTGQDIGFKPTGLLNKDIVWKELFAIASAVNTWGFQWPWEKVMAHCDNSAVVDI